MLKLRKQSGYIGEQRKGNGKNSRSSGSSPEKPFNGLRALGRRFGKDPTAKKKSGCCCKNILLLFE